VAFRTTFRAALAVWEALAATAAFGAATPASTDKCGFRRKKAAEAPSTIEEAVGRLRDMVSFRVEVEDAPYIYIYI
jgi:hypothetical protein